MTTVSHTLMYFSQLFDLDEWKLNLQLFPHSQPDCYTTIDAYNSIAP